ncbi:hypothetical protein AAW14_00460 [Streptomyces hygroscopicus]|uniref:hypothetical protein n=1 Tax=Streptomyces hygroscopicus TaxID=1912 RepID=UPI00224003A0|nr:hypothetical protein [Streptomyces hygroscopicus]MCW7940573.1 hypothetical protein [Streptomyces hygroscopicus]
MTGPGVPHELPPLARPGTTARQPASGGGCGAASPDGPIEWAFATHRPCPVDGCLGPAQVPMRPPADLPAHDRGGPDHDTSLCKRCGADSGVPAEV